MLPRLARVKSALLLTIFLSAGTSLPGLDGLLFHLHAGEHQRAQIHVEPTGGCLDHAEHCVLGRTATGAGAVATPVTEVRVEPASRAALKPLPTQPGRSHTRGVIHQPRAPPALPAV